MEDHFFFYKKIWAFFQIFFLISKNH